MKKIVFISILVGILVTISLTLTTVKLNWSDTDAVCPGIPFPIKADATAGFPLTSGATVSTMGTCGEVTGGLTASGLVKLLLTLASMANLCIWSLASLLFIYVLKKFRVHRL